jgi:uncharacterized protein
MLPFYFGAGRRRLFGVYDSARGGAATVRAAVLCYPWGEEYIHAHRTMRRLAILLSSAGIHTLRFDYFGTGDSGGEADEANFQGCMADTATAIDELRDMTGARRVALVGLRFGATLAAAAAVKRPEEVDALVLWDPIVSGAEHLKAIYESSPPNAAGRGVAATHESAEARQAGGGALAPTMASELSVLDLPPMIPELSARTLIILTEMLRSRGEVVREQVVSPIVVEHVQDICPWLEDPRKVGAISATVLRRIVQWLK